MKKWIITLVISAACFGLFFALSGFCEFIPYSFVKATFQPARLFQIYKLSISGFQLSVYIISLLVLASLSLFIVSVIMVQKHCKSRRSWSILFALVFPVLVFAYASQEKVYSYQVEPFPSVRYTAVFIDKKNNTICLQPVNGVKKPVTPVYLKANAESIQVVESATKRGNYGYMQLDYRKNMLSGIEYIEEISIVGSDLYRIRPFMEPDYLGLISVYKGHISVYWPWSKPVE